MPRSAWIATIIVAVLAVYNGIVAVPVMIARRGEAGITMVAYRRWLIDPTTAVVDVWRVDADHSMADVDRNLFLTAEALKGQGFSQVELAYRGRGRFLIDGARFKDIGEQWRTQSVAYLISAFPEAAKRMDGQPAFETWTGGFLGVLMKQMQDHNQMHWSWYLANMSGADPDTPMPEKPSVPAGI